MRLSHVIRDDAGDGWFLTFEGGWWIFKWRKQYWTEKGTYFWDRNGNRPGLLTEFCMEELFIAKVDWLGKKLWSKDHPSPDMKAARRHIEAQKKSINRHQNKEAQP